MELATPEAGCERGRAVHGSIVHPELTRDGDTPPEDGLDYIPPTPGFLNDETHDTLGHSPSVVIISNDEIDSEKTDTFGPFLQGTSPDLPPDSNGSEKFLDEITFVGMEDQIIAMKLLCLEFRDLFSNKIATLPAKLDPFRLDVREQEWEISANRTPVRPQSSRKEIEIKKALDEMLSLGIIESSSAVYYSHPVVVQKTADTYRFCIDYRLLNACMQPASFPLPNIRGLFERIGRHQADIFGVMDLTAGYHQAPLYEPHRHFTAFICYTGIFHFLDSPLDLGVLPLTSKSRWPPKSFAVSYI